MTIAAWPRLGTSCLSASYSAPGSAHVTDTRTTALDAAFAHGMPRVQQKSAREKARGREASLSDAQQINILRVHTEGCPALLATGS